MSMYTYMKKEIVAIKLSTPEGPVVLRDKRISFTEQLRGRISALDISGNTEVIAVTEGAPNSQAVGPGQARYVAQNGGVVGRWRAQAPTMPCIQRVRSDGSVESLITASNSVPIVAPNDLAFGPDGRLYITDPAQPFDPGHPRDEGRIIVSDGQDATIVVELGGVYCNGIGFDVDGKLTWVESYYRRVCTLDAAGKPKVLCRLPSGQTPDGFAVADDGRFFIATCESHGITVIAPDGSYLGVVYLDKYAHPSNCCFDGSALWVTDFGVNWESDQDQGRLWCVETDARRPLRA